MTHIGHQHQKKYASMYCEWKHTPCWNFCGNLCHCKSPTCLHYEPKRQHIWLELSHTVTGLNQKHANKQNKKPTWHNAHTQHCWNNTNEAFSLVKSPTNQTQVFQNCTTHGSVSKSLNPHHKGHKNRKRCQLPFPHTARCTNRESVHLSSQSTCVWLNTRPPPVMQIWTHLTTCSTKLTKASKHHFKVIH